MNRTPATPGRLRLADYYVIEGLNSAAATLFLLSIFFWTKHRFGFSDGANLLLGVAQGICYLIFSPLGGRLGDRAGYLRVVLISVGAAILLLLGGLAVPGAWMPFVLIAAYTAAMALIWPSLEGAIMHAPGRLTMPQRAAMYNIVWALAGALGFFASGALFAWRPDAVLGCPVLLHAAQLVWIALRRAGAAAADARAAMDMPHGGDTVPRSRKQRFMHTAWLANTLGYFVITSFGALTPAIGERLGLSPRHAIWLACTMFFSRGATFLVLGRWEGWHYRWRWLMGSLVILPVSLGFIFFSGQIPVVLASLAVMGVVLGLIYSASLYYSLDFGENKGEHGGLHESMIGLGILTGPLVGAAGVHWGGVTGAHVALLAVYAVAGTAGLAAILGRRQVG